MATGKFVSSAILVSFLLSSCVSAPSTSMFQPRSRTGWVPPPTLVYMRLLFAKDVKAAWFARYGTDGSHIDNTNPYKVDSYRPDGPPDSLGQNKQNSAMIGPASPETQAEMTRTMLSSGFGLVYANCDTFFRQMGRNQKRVGIYRDLIAPVTNIFNAILALQDFSARPREKEDILSVITAGSSGFTAGLTIYETRYLFSSTNIDSVRTLTLDTLVAHRKQVAAKPPVVFEDAMIQLLDNEAICSPPHILAMTQQAIKAAKPDDEPTPSPAPTPSPTPTLAPSPTATPPLSLSIDRYSGDVKQK